MSRPLAPVRLHHLRSQHGASACTMATISQADSCTLPCAEGRAKFWYMALMKQLLCSITHCTTQHKAATHHHGEVGADFGKAERVAELIVSKGELRAPAPGVSLRKLCMGQHAASIVLGRRALHCNVLINGIRSGLMSVNPICRALWQWAHATLQATQDP